MAEGADVLMNLNEELTRHLMAKGDLMPTFVQFACMETNEQRVSFIYELLVENGLLPDLSLDGKSATKSEEYRYLKKVCTYDFKNKDEAENQDDLQTENEIADDNI